MYIEHSSTSLLYENQILYYRKFTNLGSEIFCQMK